MDSSSRVFGRVRAVQPFVAHSSSVQCLALGRKSAAVLCTGGDDAQVNVWRVGRPAALLSLAGSASGVASVDFNHNEDLVAAGAEGGGIRVFDLANAGKVVRKYQGHRSRCMALDHHPYGGYIVSGSMDTTVRLWDLRRKSCMSAYKGHSSAVTCVRFSPDGSMVASGSEAGRIMIWDLTAGKLLHEFKHSGGVRGLEYHPNDFLLASTGGDRCIRFWDVDRMCLIEQTARENAVPSCIRFKPDGSELISASSDSARAWRWEPSQMVAHLDAPWDAVGDMRLSSTRQNQLVICSSADSFVSAWVVNLDGNPGGNSKSGEPLNRKDLKEGDDRVRREAGNTKTSDSPQLGQRNRHPSHQRHMDQPKISRSSASLGARGEDLPRTAPGEKEMGSVDLKDERLYSPPRSPVISPRRKSPSLRDLEISGGNDRKTPPSEAHSVGTSMGSSLSGRHVDSSSGNSGGKRLNKDGQEEKLSFDAATSMGASFLGRAHGQFHTEGKETRSDERAMVDILVNALPGANYKPDSEQGYVRNSPMQKSAVEADMGGKDGEYERVGSEDCKLVESARSGSAEFSNLMTDRLREMRVIGRLWASNSTKSSRNRGKNSAMRVLSHLEKSMKNDPQLALDFVLSTPLDMGAFDLQSCVTLLPMLSALLDHCAFGTEHWCEEHALGLFEAVQTLYRGFGGVVKSNAQQGAIMKGGGRVRTKGVDAEQRIFRATSCFESFKRLANQVKQHVGRPGGVGRAAGELSQLLHGLE